MTVLRLIYNLREVVQNNCRFVIKLLASSYSVKSQVNQQSSISKLYQILKCVRSHFPMSVSRKCSHHNTRRGDKTAADCYELQVQSKRLVKKRVCTCVSVARVYTVSVWEWEVCWAWAQGWQFSLTSTLCEMHWDMLWIEMTNISLWQKIVRCISHVYDTNDSLFVQVLYSGNILVTCM